MDSDERTIVRELVDISIFAVCGVLIAACGAATATSELRTRTPTAPTTDSEVQAASPSPSSGAVSRPPLQYGYTYLQPNGNRVMSTGRGSLPDIDPVDVELAGVPAWVVAAPSDDGAIWAVQLANGQVQAFQNSSVGIHETDIQPRHVPPDMPPVLAVGGQEATLLTPPVAQASTPSHPVMLDDGQRIAYIGALGDLIVSDGDGDERLAVNALPDARLLTDDTGNLLLLTDPTERYTHGVLGDQIEAASITLVETSPALRVAQKILLPEPQVVEGIAPIWADINGDNQREIIATVSDASQGAQIVVFNATGDRVAEGPAVGRGFRWRHQLALAPFGLYGDLELADVLTPHLGGVVEFYRLEEDQLRIIARVPRYTSHVIGTRNLDMAAAGDFDGDGQLELLVPNQERTRLGGIRRTTEGAEVVWEVPADGLISTNLAIVKLSDAQLAVGVGRADGVLRLWLP